MPLRLKLFLIGMYGCRSQKTVTKLCFVEVLTEPKVPSRRGGKRENECEFLLEVWNKIFKFNTIHSWFLGWLEYLIVLENEIEDVE